MVDYIGWMGGWRGPHWMDALKRHVGMDGWIDGGVCGDGGWEI